MLLNPHRMGKLIELADLERHVTGPERMVREEDVSILVKAAYDDASDAARAEFVALAKQTPTSAWPWSAVQASSKRAPAVLMLLRGQADSADMSPGNRIPDRGQPEAAAWEPLYKALDVWDTATIKKWISTQGWKLPGVRVMNLSPQTAGSILPLGGTPPRNGGGVNPGNGGGTRPGSGVNPGNGGTTPPGNTGVAPPGTGDAGPPPDGSPPSPPEEALTWRHPAVLAAGATVLTTLGVALYSLSQGRGRALPASSPPAATEATKQ